MMLLEILRGSFSIYNSLLESGLIESRQLQGNLSFGMYRYDFATKLVRKKALKLLLLQPISTIYHALVEAPGKHIHYIANLEKPWYKVVLKVFLIMLLCPVGRVYMTCNELRDTDRNQREKRMSSRVQYR
ncbi:uncharacterized protein LOC126597387 [Malus sylvestris]|uniref:uncharacterized protein LOC126597387 n=1 Tax=Malus sylvestris TaxID=3752 RepID=UPI0021AC5174|nr:uncharacterized protein LOC126597387 [Malus sylvestris]